MQQVTTDTYQTTAEFNHTSIKKALFDEGFLFRVPKMFKPLSLSFALRYTASKKHSGFVSFISLSSMFGIAIGVMVLITVLSVMNGFDYEIHHRFFSMSPEITISDYSGKLSDWQMLESKVNSRPDIQGVAPFIGGQGLLSFQGRNQPVVISGILPAEEEKIIHLSDKFVQGNLKGFSNYGIILGQSLASQLGVFLNDKVTLMIPELSTSIAGSVPRFKRFTVIAIFKAGSGFNFDSRLAFINLNNAQKLFQMGESVSGLRVKISSPYKAPLISYQLSKELKNEYAVGNWTEQYGAFFKAVKMEKTMMFLILVLIIAVAAFNLVSSLVMMVNDKQSDIAILRTMGGSRRFILKTFILQGLLVGVIGTVLGVCFGVLLALNATAIVDFLQSFFHTELLATNAYFVDYLPSKLQMSDIITTSLVALFLSFIATLYPAFKAASIDPAEALRYE